MKIFSIINNYSDSGVESPFAIKEAEPLSQWYELPDSSVLRSGNPFFVPEFDDHFRAFPSLVYRIGRLGKSIAPRFASRYIDGWTAGCAIVATGLLRRLREQGAPWTRAVAFDRSLLLGNLQPIDTLLNIDRTIITTGPERICYQPNRLIRDISMIINDLSSDNTLKNGDLILVGLTPVGLRLAPGMRLQASLDNNTTLLDISIK